MENYNDIINKILKFTPIILLLLSSIVFLIAFLIKDKKTLKRNWIKNFTYQAIIYWKGFVDYILPKEKKEYKKLEVTLRKAGYKSIYKFYVFKVSCLLIFAIFMLSAYNADMNYEVKQQFTKISNSSDIINTQNLYKYYNYLKRDNMLNIKEISRANIEYVLPYIQQCIENKSGLTPELAYSHAVIFSAAIINVNEKNINVAAYLIFGIIGYYLPNGILYILINIKQAKYNKGLPALKLATSLLIPLNLSTAQIIKVLSGISPIYRPILRDCINDFSNADIGPKKAIEKMSNNAPFVPFRKLCSVFKDLERGNDREQTQKNLDITIQQEKKSRNLKIRDKGRNKIMIATFIIFVSLFAEFLLMIQPAVQQSLFSAY